MVHEWGFIIHTGTAVPTEGMFLRTDATGVTKAVLCNNSSEVMSAAINWNSVI
jgi:hypothetical protein